jgi:hypothetical protein
VAINEIPTSSYSEQHHAGQQKQGNDHLSPIDGIPQGNDQQHPAGIADLRQRNQEAEMRCRATKFTGNDSQQRLRIVNIGDNQARCEREQPC